MITSPSSPTATQIPRLQSGRFVAVRALVAQRRYSQIFEHDFWGADIRSNSSHKSFRPLTTLSFRLSRWLTQRAFGWGEQPETINTLLFHGENLAWHALATLLVYALAQRLHRFLACPSCAATVSNSESSKGDSAGEFEQQDRLQTTQPLAAGQTAAIVCALLFAAHPVHTEAVTGIVGALPSRLIPL